MEKFAERESKTEKEFTTATNKESWDPDLQLWMCEGYLWARA